MRFMGTCKYCRDTIDFPNIITPWGDHVKCQEKCDHRKNSGLCIYCGKTENYHNEPVIDGCHESCEVDGTYYDY